MHRKKEKMQEESQSKQEKNVKVRKGTFFGERFLEYFWGHVHITTNKSHVNLIKCIHLKLSEVMKFMEKSSSLKFMYGVLAVAAGAALPCAVLPFDAYPFGFALLCASGAYAPLVLAGLCIGTLAARTSALLISAYILTLAIRAFISLIGEKNLTLEGVGKYIFSEPVSFRAVEAAAACFCFGLFKLWSGGFLYYDLIGVFISMLLAAVLVLLWYRPSGKGKKGIFSDIGAISFFAALTWSLRTVGLYGASFAILFCIAVSLGAAKKRGVIFASFTGLVCGLCVSLPYAPMFVFGVVAYSFFGMLSPLAGCVFSFMAQMLWGYYISGFSAIGVLLPSLIAGNAIFYFYSKLFLSGRTEEEQEKEENAEKKPLSLEEYTALASYEALKAEIRRLCDGVDKMAVQKAHISGSVVSRCTASIIDANIAYTPDAQMSVALFDALRESLGEKVEALYAYRGNRLNVAVMGDIDEIESEIKARAENICGVRFFSVKNKTDEKRTCILLCQSSVLTVDISGKSKNAAGEKKFCGDNFEIVKSDDGTDASVIISDGMGSGREAARISGLCSRFLLNLFPFGARESADDEAFIDALNSFLRTKNTKSECSCTLDFARFDLVKQAVTLCKCGSAPTYVFRDGSIFKLRSGTVPMGIFEYADIGRTQMELLPNDVIVMVSDGAIDGDNDGDGLAKYLSERILTHNAEQLAEAVIKYSSRIGSHDDVTAVAITVGEKVFEY